MNNAMESLITVVVLAAVVVPAAARTHPNGFNDSQQLAEQRAKELGCRGTHQHNGKSMPCSNEAALHQLPWLC
jgi:ribonuclease HII